MIGELHSHMFACIHWLKYADLEPKDDKRSIVEDENGNEAQEPFITTAAEGGTQGIKSAWFLFVCLFLEIKIFKNLLAFLLTGVLARAMVAQRPSRRMRRSVSAKREWNGSKTIPGTSSSVSCFAPPSPRGFEFALLDGIQES